MSKHINVNPGQYKEGGREHQGDQVLHAVNKQQYTQAEKAQEETASLIPNQHDDQNEHPETPASGGGENRAGNATSSANSSKSSY